MENKKSIQSLDRAMDILEYIWCNDNSCRLQDISCALNLNKSTAYNLISTLEKRGYVYQDCNTLRYSLGINTLKLGVMNLSQLPYMYEITKLLDYLTKVTGESSVFALCLNTKYFYFHAVPSSQQLRVSHLVGTFEDINLPSSLGKLFRGLANGEDIPYALDFEEVEPGLNCCSFPYYKNNILIGAIAISGPSHRCTKELFLRAYTLYKNYLIDNKFY